MNGYLSEIVWMSINVYYVLWCVVSVVSCTCLRSLCQPAQEITGAGWCLWTMPTTLNKSQPFQILSMSSFFFIRLRFSHLFKNKSHVKDRQANMFHTCWEDGHIVRRPVEKRQCNYSCRLWAVKPAQTSGVQQLEYLDVAGACKKKLHKPFVEKLHLHIYLRNPWLHIFKLVLGKKCHTLLSPSPQIQRIGLRTRFECLRPRTLPLLQLPHMLHEKAAILHFSSHFSIKSSNLIAKINRTCQKDVSGTWSGKMDIHHFDARHCRSANLMISFDNEATPFNDRDYFRAIHRSPLDSQTNSQK